MPEIQISCPECGNKRGVPDNLVGKKIKCKKCQSIFTVKSSAPDKGAKSTGVRGGAIPLKKNEEEDDKKPYVMQFEDLAARCPHCAMKLDPPDAKVCVHCGYHMQKRKRAESVQTYELTPGDYFLYHIPTFLCFVAISILVGFDVFAVYNMAELMKGSWFEDVLPDRCWNTWLMVMSLFLIFFAGRFIFRRLVWRFHPPEKLKQEVQE